MAKSRSHLLPLFLAAALARSAAAGVIVVDAAGGGSFTDIGPAVASAADGDVLLVKGGVYTGFSVTDKALDVVADSGAAVLVHGWVRIQPLAATRTVTLTGLEIQAPPAFAALILTSCAGSVRIQGCTLRGGDGVPCAPTVASWGADALRVSACDDVAIERSTLLGGAAEEDGIFGGVGGNGLDAGASRLALHDCVIRGGEGHDFLYSCPPGYGYGYGGIGGGAVELEAMVAFFAGGSTLTGGDGGEASVPGGMFPGCGGRALVSAGSPSSALRALDTLFALGTSAPGASASCAQAPVDVQGATFTIFGGSARRINGSRVTREGHVARIEVTGVPGDRVELTFAERGRFAPTDAQRGVHLVARRTPHPVLLAGTIPASGTLTVGWPVGELGGGVAARRLFVQASCVDAAGVTTLTGVVTLVLLDAAY
jgi:hypothetical protein